MYMILLDYLHILNFGTKQGLFLSLSPNSTNDQVFAASIVINQVINMLVDNPAIPFSEYLFRHTQLAKVYLLAAPSDDQQMILNALGAEGTHTRYKCTCGCIHSEILESFFIPIPTTIPSFFLDIVRYIRCSK